MAKTITCIECGCEFDEDRGACPVCGTEAVPQPDDVPNLFTRDITGEPAHPVLESEPPDSAPVTFEEKTQKEHCFTSFLDRSSGRIIHPPNFKSDSPREKHGLRRTPSKPVIIAGIAGVLIVAAIILGVIFIGPAGKGPALPKQESFDGPYGSSAALIAGGGVAVPVEDGMFYVRYGDAGSGENEPGIYWDSDIAPKGKALGGVRVSSDCGCSLNYYKNSLVYLASTDGKLPSSFASAREIRVLDELNAEEPGNGSTIYKTNETKTIGCMQVYDGSAYFIEKATDSSYEVKGVSLEGGHASKILCTLSVKSGSDAWMFIENDTLYVAYSAKGDIQANGSAAPNADSSASALAATSTTVSADNWRLDSLPLQQSDAKPKQALTGEGTLECALYEDGWLYYALSGADSPLYCLSDANERRDAAAKNASRLTACGKYVMAITSDGKAMLMHTASNIALDVTSQDTQADISSVSASMSGCAMTDEYMLISELNGRIHLYPSPEECFEEAG